MIEVSVPGKIHLLGEHAVVYGKPALLTAINKRCRVKLIPRKDKQIEIVSKNFKSRILLSISDVFKKRDKAQRNLETFLKNGDVDLLKSITKDPIDYATIAVGEALGYYRSVILSETKDLASARDSSPRLRRAQNDKLGFSLTIESDIPVGAGLGSSAAVAVAIASAVSLFLTRKIDIKSIYDTAFRIEQRKHGRPSGGDPATVLHGGLVWFRKETDDLKIIQPLQDLRPAPFTIPRNITKNFYLIDTGKPKESTGEMVASVKKQFDAEPEKIGKIFDDQERLTRELLTAIKNSDSTLIIRIIRVGEKNLERLGVVSPSVKKLIREIEKSGGAAKISGGGGKTKGTGMLLVYHEDRKKLELVIQSHKLPLLNVNLGIEGLRLL